MKRDLTFALVRAAGTLATYCDRAEHSEVVDRQSVTAAARSLRCLAVATSHETGCDLHALYGERISEIEQRHPAFTDDMFDGASTVRIAKTWAQLQSAQYRHDKAYHPDVIGLAKWDQVRHYTLHISKLAMLSLEASESETDWNEFLVRRLPDIVIFGIKLSTVCGERLSDETGIDEAM